MKQKQAVCLRYIVVLSVLLLFTVFAGLHPYSAAAESDYLTVDITAEYGQTEARSMLKLVNELRTGEDAWYWNETNTQKVECKDLTEFTYDYKLEKVAMQRAMELVLAYSHTRPNGKSCFSAYDEEGIQWQAVGENIAIGRGGNMTAEEVFESWAEENEDYEGQGHRRNMLSQDMTAIGIGHVVYNGVHYWVQEFASPVSNAEETPAIDEKKTVAVELLKSEIAQVVVKASPESYSLLPGENKELPNVSAFIRMTETWNSAAAAEIPLPCTWKSQEPVCAEISGNSIIGRNTGSTYLTTDVEMNGTRSVRVPVTVQSLSLNNAAIELEKDSYTYDGTEKKPNIVVTAGGKKLTEHQDYTVSYSDNVNAGTACVQIKGVGNYTGNASKTFRIQEKTLKNTMVNEIADITYTGQAVTPAVTVRDGAKTLILNKDYTVTYSDNTESGTANVQITGKGNYTGTCRKSFTIQPKPLDHATVEGISDQTYCGSPWTQTLQVKDGSKVLKENRDYQVTYSDNVNAGTAHVQIKGAGNYIGSLTRSFTIKEKSIQETTIDEIQEQAYTGEKICPVVTVQDGTRRLTEGVDYTVTYQDNVECGKAEATISGIGNYTGTQRKTFDIKKSIVEVQIENIANQTYCGEEIMPELIVKDGEALLTEGIDYQVSYQSNLNAGIAAVQIEGRGYYTGCITKSFVIQRRTITDAVISTIEPYTYVGTAIVPSVTVTENGEVLQNGRDYTVAYSDNVNAGTAKVTVEGVGNYCDRIEATFKIQKAVQRIVSAASYTKVYGNKPFNLGAKAKTKLSYKSNNPKVAMVSNPGNVTLKGPGKTNITITAAATGNYNAAAKNITITVNPKEVVLKRAKSTKKRTLKVMWKRDAKATGYQVVIAQNKRFKKGKKTALIKKNKTTSRTFKKLKSRKNYYYKVRAYKQVGKTKLYGAYNKAKKVRVK